MIIAIAPLIFVIVGALMWGFTNGKASDAGRIIFAAGVLALALSLASHTVRIG